MENKGGIHSFQRSGARKLSNLVASGAMSSSLPVLPAPSGARFPTGFIGKGNNGKFCASTCNSIGLQQWGGWAHVFISFRVHNRSPFLFQSSSDGISLPLTHSSHSGVFQSRLMSRYPRENSDIAWSADWLQSFLDFPENVPTQNNQVESSNSGIMPSDDNTKPSDWQEWADQLIRDDDPLTSNWNELLADRY